MSSYIIPDFIHKKYSAYQVVSNKDILKSSLNKQEDIKGKGEGVQRVWIIRVINLLWHFSGTKTALQKHTAMYRISIDSFYYELLVLCVFLYFVCAY